MGGKHNCCCTTSPGILYAGSFEDSRLYQIDASTGAFFAISSGILSSVRHIACDPTTGNIYVSGATGVVYCLDSTGSVLWSTTVGGGALIYWVCVSNDGYVYAAFHAGGPGGGVYKLDAATGVEITAGWPYLPGGGATFEPVCVDQSGNVYAGVTNTAGTMQAVSLDASGAVRWTSLVSSITTGGFHGLAINAAGTQLIGVREADAFDISDESHFILNAADGSFLGAFRPPTAGGLPVVGCDWGPNISYAVARRDAPFTGRPDVYSSLSSPFFNSLTPQAFGLIATRDGGVYLGTQPSEVTGDPQNYNLWGCIEGWKALLPFSPGTLLYTVAAAEGRIGAFGL